MSGQDIGGKAPSTGGEPPAQALHVRDITGSVLVIGNWNTVIARIRASHAAGSPELALCMERFRDALDAADPRLSRAEWEKIDQSLKQVAGELQKPEDGRDRSKVAIGLKRIADILNGAGIVMRETLALAEPVKRIAEIVGIPAGTVP